MMSDLIADKVCNMAACDGIQYLEDMFDAQPNSDGIYTVQGYDFFLPFSDSKHLYWEN